MKKLTIFLSFTTKESDLICEKMVNAKSNQEFLGFWGKIRFNAEECLNTISSTVNHFITSDKEEIYFGVNEADLDELLLRINTENCEIIKINRAEFELFNF